MMQYELKGVLLNIEAAEKRVRGEMRVLRMLNERRLELAHIDASFHVAIIETLDDLDKGYEHIGRAHCRLNKFLAAVKAMDPLRSYEEEKELRENARKGG